METNREKIANGQCVSPGSTDECLVCVDCCEAFYWKMHLKETLQEAGIDNTPSTDKQ